MVTLYVNQFSGPLWPVYVNIYWWMANNENMTQNSKYLTKCQYCNSPAKIKRVGFHLRTNLCVMYRLIIANSVLESINTTKGQFIITIWHKMQSNRRDQNYYVTDNNQHALRSWAGQWIYQISIIWIGIGYAASCYFIIMYLSIVSAFHAEDWCTMQMFFSKP